MLVFEKMMLPAARCMCVSVKTVLLKGSKTQ